MAAEVITIGSSSDDDSPPPSRRASPTVNKASAPRASYGGSNLQQSRFSTSNVPYQPAARSLVSKNGGGRRTTARKSTGGGPPSDRGTTVETRRTSGTVQLSITDSDEEEEESADALRPADKIASDSDEDDPIAIRPSASPSKVRPPSTASSAKVSEMAARTLSYTDYYTSPNSPSPRSKPSAALQRRPSSTQLSDVAEATPSFTAKHAFTQVSSPKRITQSVARLRTFSNQTLPAPHRRSSAPLSSLSDRRVPRKKRLSMQEGGEVNGPYRDQLRSPSQYEMVKDPGPSGKGARRQTTFDEAGNEILDLVSDDDDEISVGDVPQETAPKESVEVTVKEEQALAVKEDGLVATETEEFRPLPSKYAQGGKRSSTDSAPTPPSPPKRRLSAPLPSLAATANITHNRSRDGELDRQPSRFLRNRQQALASPASHLAPSSWNSEDDDPDRIAENGGDEADEEDHQQEQLQQLQRNSIDEMEVDQDDEHHLSPSPELGLPMYTAAEKGKGRAMDLDEDDSTLMPPPPPPPPSKRLLPAVASATELAEVTRIASALAAFETESNSYCDANALSPSTAYKTARKSTGAPSRVGYAPKSTGTATGATLARKSTASKPKPVAHASLSGAGRREKGMTWEELIDLTGDTSDEDDDVEDENEEAEEEEDELSDKASPMETDNSPRALSDVSEEEEPVEESTFEAEPAVENSVEPAALAHNLADMSVADDDSSTSFAEDTVKGAQRTSFRISAGAVAKENIDVVSARLTRSSTRPAPPPPLVKIIQNPKRDALQAVVAEPAPVEKLAETPAEMKRRAQAFMAHQRAIRSPWRQIAGPSFAGEHQEIEDNVRQIQLRDRRFKWAHGEAPTLFPDPDDTALLENIIAESNLAHLPRAPGDLPRVRIVPTSDGLPPYTPPWEFVYSHRVIYPPDLPPTQAPGCGCQGDCGSAENEASCACRLRQQGASTIKTLLHDPTLRSGITGFAYTKDGRVKPELFENSSMEPIVECNSECGCDESCVNRVVGKVPSISIDIINTGKKGWAIRNPPSYTYRLWPDGEELAFEGRVIKRGTPMGIYASEMLLHEEGDQRCEELYNDVGRNYLFGLDHVAILEELRLQQPDVVDAARAAQAAAETSTAASHGTRSKKQKSEKARLVSSKEGRRLLREMGQEVFEAMSREEADGKPDSRQMDPVYMLDAFFYGNWTRFANHSCSKFNTAVCPVFVDEADWSRPLYVFIASSDIQPGEEIAITYHGDRPELDDLDLATYKREANMRRKEADKSWRCFCGEDLCRGVMFSNYVPDTGEDGDEGGAEEGKAAKRKKKGKKRRY